jgi:hypothetical protein
MVGICEQPLKHVALSTALRARVASQRCGAAND